MTLRKGVGWAAVAVLVAGGCMGSGSAVPTVRMDPVRVPAPGADPLAPVAFLSGCWRSAPPPGGTALEERWGPAEGGVMLGTSRFVRDGRVVSFEFGLVRADGDGITLLPHPGGVASEHAFRATVATGTEARFEAPEHDYPRRIHYRLLDGDLEARIDSGEGDESPRIWRMTAVPCA